MLKTLSYCCIFIMSLCSARIGVNSLEHDWLSVKMLNPGYILNTLQSLCVTFKNDIDLLVHHTELYQDWIIKSDYLLDQCLELYTYVCYLLLFKYDMHSYLQEDTAFIIHHIKQASEHYYELVKNFPENIHAVFFAAILQKTLNKSLLLINLTKEVSIYTDP